MTGRSVALAVVGLMAARAVAAADTPIVIESYSGPRPENAGRLLGPVLEELATHGFAVGYDGIGRMFEAQVSRTSRTASGMPGDFVDAIDRGHKAWIAGKYDDAVDILTPLIETAHGNAAVVSQDSKLRTAIQRGLLDLALAQQRRGDTAAGETMAELMRSFPGVAITKASHGPDAFTLYEATKKALANGGTLVVEVIDSATQVFVDEQYGKNGALRQTGLYPGQYRVYAAKGDLEGRTYLVDVKPGETTTIKIDIGFDTALHVDPSWTGLAFGTSEDRAELEGRYAAQFAGLAHGNAVAVVGIDTVNGHQALVGSLVALDGTTEIARASIPIDPEPSSDRRRDLARFLAGDKSAAASLDVDDGTHGGTGGGGGAHQDRGGGSRWGVFKYITTGLGLVAGGVGAYLLVTDGNCQTDADPCPKVYNNKVSGWATVGGAAALLGLGIYMFATDAKPTERVVTIAPTGDGAMAILHLEW